MGEVEGYLSSLSCVRTSIRQSGLSASRIAELVCHYLDGAIPKTGRLSGGIEYDIHEAGCRFILLEGHVVEVDMVGGADAFDAWRILLYSSSALHPSDRGIRDIRVECDSLVRAGRLIALGQGWYVDREGT
ncbi:DUF6896 domain-containing protein [Pseudonocardia oroxyli]|uniref:DUF6896 domain-containing protein n=1 Tax=Pseudonocardia oroxyli TaxID=366584 RepID=UPI00115FC1DB|nr:hypothetical protein [Pseudonocardia oroxyli]